MNTPDQLNRYIFEEMNVRGELVQLAESYQQMLKNHHYPDSIKHIIGELFAATSLLTATLKFTGDIAVQIQGNGPVSYVAINGTDKQALRGVARFSEAPKDLNLSSAFGDKGFMVITITPEKGERYQGIVALEQETIAGCLQDYFRQSEQLDTHIWLYTDTKQALAAGMLLQRLPGEEKEQDDANMEHLAQLTSTVKHDEIFSLAAQDLLYRLYHQERVKVFEPQSVTFHCGCSKDKTYNALASIQPNELTAILQEEGKIEVKCEYCLTKYSFVENDLADLLNKPQH
ncbi:Hsp33-like chaperonin [Catenovulum agarivorans DS-2]|uniref:33 kDa chaperonin n=1 Tax=Catenovulum agarivorans DS-2 TaxID=1328313 RepID=W7QQG5_9ALTE|nr:Hsp33 family molecular chaperone HslO [Catenovulum agarivorans]EWH11227.1 Hsp33-like chaperonin [Catenovulum agarivorans DS-2]